MHQRIPNSLVIWYDSVTYKGDLAWQDELNAKNRYILNQICQEFTCNVGCWQKCGSDRIRSLLVTLSLTFCHLVSFRGWFNPVWSGYCSCHWICTFKRMLTLLFISLRGCHWNFKLPCNWTARKFFGFLYFPLFSNESSQGYAHNTPREVPGPWCFVIEMSIDPKFFMH